MDSYVYNMNSEQNLKNYESNKNISKNTRMWTD